MDKVKSTIENYTLRYLVISVVLVLSICKMANAQDTITNKIRIYKLNRVINAPADSVFRFMDDIRNTGKHMTETNAPMMGGKMNLEWLTEQHFGLGTKYRWRGRVLGMKMDFTVEVKKWTDGKEKIWESIGESKMIVISWYRMFLILNPQEKTKTEVQLGIYYTKKKGNFLSFILGKAYAKWCVKSMLRDTKKHFENEH